MLAIESAPFVCVRRPIVFFFSKESPEKQKSASGDHCNCKFFVCDLGVDKVVKEQLRAVSDKTGGMLDVEQHNVSY